MIKSPTVDKADLPFSDLWSTQKGSKLVAGTARWNSLFNRWEFDNGYQTLG
jgi:hypothetical protein